MNNLFIVIYLTTLSITLSSYSNFSDKEVYPFHENETSYSTSRSQKRHYNNYEIDFEKIVKVNQENFPKSHLLSIKSDYYYGRPAIRVTSRNGSTRKQIIYNISLDKKIGNYTHYDKHYDNKQLNLAHIISLEEAIAIVAKKIDSDFKINEWELTYEDDEKEIVWELENSNYEIKLNAKTGEVYEFDS